MYLLPEIYKSFFDVSGRPLISNCDRPTEKISHFLVHHFKSVMQEGQSYNKDTGNFLNEIKNISAIPEKAVYSRCGWFSSKYTRSIWSSSIYRGIG